MSARAQQFIIQIRWKNISINYTIFFSFGNKTVKKMILRTMKYLEKNKIKYFSKISLKELIHFLSLQKESISQKQIDSLKEL